jgi:hypothetical protein
MNQSTWRAKGLSLFPAQNKLLSVDNGGWQRPEVAVFRFAVFDFGQSPDHWKPVLDALAPAQTGSGKRLILDKRPEEHTSGAKARPFFVRLAARLKRLRKRPDLWRFAAKTYLSG